MATTTATENSFVLHVDSAYGPISRTVQKSPPRDAQPGEVPVIDVSGMFSDELSKRQAVAAEVRKACTGMGFFYIINHKVPDSITEALAEASRDFFHQSIEEKNKVSFEHQIEGYQGLNQEQINKSESIDVFEKLKITYRPSMDPVSKLDGSSTSGYQEFPWEKTASVPSLEVAYKRFFATRLVLARQLLQIMALALDLPEDYFDAKVAQPQAAVTLNYYPGKAEGEERTEPAGLGSHTDFSLITLLWQDDAGGLQILSPEGEWIKAKPIPGSLVCNVGDMMTMITGGKFISDIHRAKTEGTKERVSIPFFIGLAPKVNIEIVKTCDEPNRIKEDYEGITAGDWLRKRVMDVKLGKLAKAT
jgi:isopenicillin N synthase-like dioxygenase